ncbi:MAG: DUF4402 domain-containing protein [Bacteroidales bacterium]|nr:DUF4402 domain-containing protein [Bacteroidales bacterium]
MLIKPRKGKKYLNNHCIVLLLFFLLFPAILPAQESVSASATATANIVAPLAISNSVDMDFGNVSAGASGGTVVLATDGGRTATGTVQLAASNAGTAASYDVTGEGAYTYTITLPSGDYTITETGSETMTINTFTSNPSETGTLSSGTQTLLVGATLNVSASQVQGEYTNATGFEVTVAYN